MKCKFYLLTLAVFVLDHATKWLARTRLEAGQAIVVIPPSQ